MEDLQLIDRIKRDVTKYERPLLSRVVDPGGLFYFLTLRLRDDDLPMYRRSFGLALFVGLLYWVS